MQDALAACLHASLSQPAAAEAQLASLLQSPGMLRKQSRALTVQTLLSA